jgi:hypothetical protein
LKVLNCCVRGPINTFETADRAQSHEQLDRSS